MSTSTNTISVVSVVHGEEQYLEDAFNQFKPYVDDFVVIDQESTDRTVEIAKKFTNKILVFPRVYYPFAYYSHACLLANHEWVIKCDPDERWDDGLLTQLQDLATSNADLCLFHMDVNGNKEGLHCRMWRKNKVIWTDSLDPAPYNIENLVVKEVTGGYLRNLRELNSKRYRKEAARRLLVRYGDTKIPIYVERCKYYQDIVDGTRIY